MNYLAPAEWQIRELADAAAAVARNARKVPARKMDNAYASGVEDVLRFLLGGTPPTDTMAEIYAAYLDEVMPV